MRIRPGHHISMTSGYLLSIVSVHSRFVTSAVHPSFIRRSSVIHPSFIRRSSVVHPSLSNHYRFLFLNSKCV